MSPQCRMSVWLLSLVCRYVSSVSCVRMFTQSRVSECLLRLVCPYVSSDSCDGMSPQARVSVGFLSLVCRYVSSVSCVGMCPQSRVSVCLLSRRNGSCARQPGACGMTCRSRPTWMRSAAGCWQCSSSSSPSSSGVTTPPQEVISSELGGSQRRYGYHGERMGGCQWYLQLCMLFCDFILLLELICRYIDLNCSMLCR